MQISFSIFVLLLSACLTGIIASPIGSNQREKRMFDPYPSEIINPSVPLNIFQVCGYIGTTCMTNSDCCTNNLCGYPSGYAYDSPRCCGATTATGCKMNATGIDTGCCVHTHHCEWKDAAKKTTWCMPTLYK
jgi:hypothetical protein